MSSMYGCSKDDDEDKAGVEDGDSCLEVWEECGRFSATTIFARNTFAATVFVELRL